MSGNMRERPFADIIMRSIISLYLPCLLQVGYLLAQVWLMMCLTKSSFNYWSYQFIGTS
jgi:hypothetical protein